MATSKVPRVALHTIEKGKALKNRSMWPVFFCTAKPISNFIRFVGLEILTNHRLDEENHKKREAHDLLEGSG